LFVEIPGIQEALVAEKINLFPDGSLGPYAFVAATATAGRAENPHFHPFPGAWLPINSILGHAHKKYK